MRACIAVVVGLTSEQVAQAESQPPASQNPAEAAFEKGRLLVESGFYEQACAAFKLSQRLDPQFGTLFNLAGCYVLMGKIATAWQLYKELSRSDSKAQRREEATRLATELEPRIPRVQVGVRIDQQSPALRVFVGDTEVTSLLDVDIPFDPGHYILLANSPGYPSFRRRIYVHPEQGASVIVELEREPEPIAEPAVSEPASSRVGAKIMFATGVGLMGFGAFAGWRWYANKELGAVDDDARARASLWAGTTALSFVLGMGGISIGGVLLAAPRRSQALRVAPAVGSDAASVLVNGTF